jgi:Flp pilus assembly protein TadD
MVETEREAIAYLDECLQLARRGDWVRAEQDVDRLVEQFGLDINVLHKVGVLRHMNGRHDEAMSLYHKVLEMEPGFHYTELEMGNTFAAIGDQVQALKWYEKAITSRPDYALSYRLAAAMRRELGDHQGVAVLLGKALQIDPNNAAIAAEAAAGLVYLNRRADAVEVLAPIVKLAGVSDEHVVTFMRLLTETGDYRRLIEFVDGMPQGASEYLRFHAALGGGHGRLALAYDRNTVIATAATREAAGTWREASGVLDELCRAIARRSPYSLIRLGDGEARFLAYMDPSTRRVLSEGDSGVMMESIWHNWFGQPLAAFDSYDLAYLNAAVIRSIETATIIGVPKAGRLEVDRQHFGYLAYLDGLVAHLLRQAPERLCADASVPVALHRESPFLADLLEGAGFVGVVGPHAELPARLAARFGIGRTAFYEVPGERRLPAKLISKSDRHFPERYREIMRDLIVPERGAIFLVAAGLLGKVYCARIKALGGIAIDIGSLADGWMGYGRESRPGHFEGGPEDWVLPAVAAQGDERAGHD